jgi:hypothetical protein
VRASRNITRRSSSPVSGGHDASAGIPWDGTILSHFEQALHIASNRQYTASKQLLAEIHGWFTEGFDTADLQEATALLDEWP